PARVADDLKAALTDLQPFVASHGLLVEGKPFVAQRIVHVDVDFTLLAALGVFDPDAALKVLWNSLRVIGGNRSRINVVRRLQQSDGKSFVKAGGTQRHAPGFVAHSDFLRSGELAHN